MNDPTIKRVASVFVIALGVFLLVAFVSVRNISRSVEASDWVNHVHSCILEIEGLRSDLSIADVAAHTYVVTEAPKDRAAGLNGLSNIAEHGEILSALTRSDPDLKGQVARLRSAVDQRAEFLHLLIEKQKAGDTKAVHALLEQDSGEPAMAEIQRDLEKLKQDELARLSEKDTASYLQAQTTRWTVWTGVALDFLLLAGAAWLIRDDLSARRAAANALKTLNEQLEAKVRERTSELVAANDTLITENIERRWANLGLEHQLRYNQLIINSINDLVVLLTKASNITRINTAVTRTTGWEAHELIDKPFADFAKLTFKAPAPIGDPVAQAMTDGRELRDVDAHIDDRRGRRMVLRMALFPLRDGDKVVGAVVILQPPSPSPSSSHQHN